MATRSNVRHKIALPSSILALIDTKKTTVKMKSQEERYYIEYSTQIVFA